MNNPIELWRSGRGSMRDWTQMHRGMDRLLEDVLWPSKAGNSAALTNFSPNCDITEDKAHYFFKFDLPGLTKDQVKIEIHNNELTVSGERKAETKEENKKYHYSECSYGSFLRTFTLPAAVDSEKVEAKFDGGVLTVAVAKTEVAKPRQINIK